MSSLAASSPSVEGLSSSLQQQSSGLLITILQNAATMLGYEQLKKEQEESIIEFEGTVSLPTGFGKSLCYILLPSVFDQLRKVERMPVALVVSPLVALMQDQVAAITAMGISATLITDKHTKTTAKQSIMNGEYQIILISPEALVGGMEWRSMLATDLYLKNLVAFVIDTIDGNGLSCMDDMPR